MAVYQDVVEVVRKKFEDCFSESVVHIEGQLDKVHSVTIRLWIY
jgi:hypothetical protein